MYQALCFQLSRSTKREKKRQQLLRRRDKRASTPISTKSSRMIRKNKRKEKGLGKRSTREKLKRPMQRNNKFIDRSSMTLIRMDSGVVLEKCNHKLTIKKS